LESANSYYYFSQWTNRRRRNAPWERCGKMGAIQFNVSKNAIQKELGVDMFLLANTKN
jgi:hypothetical protein